MGKVRHRRRTTAARFLFVVVALAALTGLSFLRRAPRAASAASEEDAVLIDFSHAGYGGGGVRVPFVPGALRVRPTGGDDTALIQAALDRLASVPADAQGVRGALLLERGRFRVGGRLRLRANGIVLRGAGVGGDEAPSLGAGLRVTDEKVPAGGRVLTLESVEGLAAGDRVVVRRPSTKEWIAALGMNRAEVSFADQRLHWTPGSRDLVWDRVVASVDKNVRRAALVGQGDYDQ